MTDYKDKLSELYAEAVIQEMMNENKKLYHYPFKKKLPFMRMILIKLSVYFGDAAAFQLEPAKFDNHVQIWMDPLSDLSIMQIVRAAYACLTAKQEDFDRMPRPNQFHKLALHGRQNQMDAEALHFPDLQIEDLNKSCNTELAERHLTMMFIKAGRLKDNDWVKRRDSANRQEHVRYYQYGAGETENENFDVINYICNVMWKRNDDYDRLMAMKEIAYLRELPDA